MDERKIKISDATRKAWEERDKSLDDGDVPQLSPDVWANATIGKYYRQPDPNKTYISFAVDNDVFDWLKREGHLSRINAILREQMQRER
jgi:uncharacterized protein (DUF4415 family)